MSRLTREQLLDAATKLPTETVYVEELGGDVVLTTLSANDRLDWERVAWPNGEVDVKEYWAGLVARTLIGEDGKPLLTTEEVGMFARPTIQKLNDVASRLNGIGAEAVAATEGKSEGTSVSDQPSSSPGDSDTPTPA
jgi:hypothetical protein